MYESKVPFLQLSTLSKGHSQDIGDNIVMPEVKNNHSGQGRWKILATTENGEILKERNQKGNHFISSTHIYVYS